MPDHIRVLIADDHLIVREGLRMILETGEAFELVGEAADGASAVRLVGECRPDVVLMDLRMPGVDGLEAIEQIHARWPQIAIIILTTYNEDDSLVRGLRRGACGYLLKDTDRETLFRSIQAAARGDILLKPETMARLLAQIEAKVPPAIDSGVDLTQRELQVLQAVARGERNKEIAARLFITERTVKAHLDSIYNKLGVDSRAAAVSVAGQKGLLAHS